MTRSFRILLAAFAAAFAVAGASTASAGSITLSDPNCDSFNVAGPVGNQTLTCVVSTPPVCTVQGPGSAQVGVPTSLTANCSPAATSWVWTGGSCATQTGQICTANEASAGPVAYKVTGTNAVATGNQSFALSVTWGVGAPPAPTGCVASISTSPSTLTNAGGTATVSVSGCSPASVTYNWTRNVTPNWDLSATPPADTLPAGGTAGYTNTYTAQVCNGSTCISLPSKTAFVPGTSGGGGSVPTLDCSAAGYSSATKVMDLTYPATTATTSGIRNYSLGPNGGTNKNWGLNFGNNDMIIVRFVAQAPETVPGAAMQIGFSGESNSRIATLATVPCAVATPTTSPAGALRSFGGIPMNIGMIVGTTKAGYTKLTSGVTYYVNIVNRDVSTGLPSCSSSNCPIYIDFN